MVTEGVPPNVVPGPLPSRYRNVTVTYTQGLKDIRRASPARHVEHPCHVRRTYLGHFSDIPPQPRVEPTERHARSPGGNLIPPGAPMMLRGLPVRVPGVNRRNAGAGGSRPPGSYGVRTAGVLVSYDVRTLYAYPPDRGISRVTRSRNTLSILYVSLAKVAQKL